MSTVASVIESLAHLHEPDGAWQPRLLDGRDPSTPGIIRVLAEEGAVTRVHDTIEQQLAELLEARSPASKPGPDELRARARDHLGGAAIAEYGTWVFYPWSGRLVHVLPEAEFREVRTSRNRNKITAAEQERLRGLRVGVIGLSVGAATAITLAMEEVGGQFVLADFDRLSLSNMNRLRAGVHALDEKKAYLTAREIYEINPYARVEIWPEGVTPESLDAFLTWPRKLDLLFEECDDLYVKVRVRECARVYGIPVLMETSDRGLFDIERFDLEPHRPIFHGLLGDLAAESLRGLSPPEKIPTVLRIVDDSRVSPRLAASLLEVGSTISTWPQVASSIALGAALNTDAARRVALGQFNASGRFYVDLAALLRDGAQIPVKAQPPIEMAPEALRPRALPPIRRAAPPITEGDARSLVASAVLAPSDGNRQPWRFELEGGVLHAFLVAERAAPVLDFGHRASHLALGAAIENIALAAAEMGLDAHASLFPSPDDPARVCSLRFTARATPPLDTRLFAQIAARATNRRLGPRAPLPALEAAALVAEAEHAGARLRLLTGAEPLAALGALLGRADRLRFLSRALHEEMIAELRWSRAEVERTRDGIDVTTLERPAPALAALRVATRYSVMEQLAHVGGGRALEAASRMAVEAASAVGLLTVEGADPASFVRAGRAMQRVWLGATAAGWAIQPLSTLPLLLARLDHGGPGLPPDEVAELRALREGYRALLPIGDGESEALLFRIARAEPPSALSLRRDVDDVLSVRR